MSSSPTSPTSHVLLIMFGPLRGIRGVFISFIGFEPKTSARVGQFWCGLLGHSRQAFDLARSVLFPTMADLALPSDTPIPSVSLSTFWKPSLAGFIGNLVCHISNEEHYIN